MFVLEIPSLIFRGKPIIHHPDFRGGRLKTLQLIIERYGIALEICQFLYLDITYFIYHPDFLGYVQLSIFLLICPYLL